MKQPAVYPIENAIPIATGLTWILWSTDAGLLRLVLGLLPGALMLSGGVSVYLLPGDLRAPQVIAVGATLGAALALPLLLLGGIGEALVLAGLAAASFVACGWTSHSREPSYERVPEPPLDLALASKVALDQLALGSMVVRRSDALGSNVPAHAADIAEALNVFRERGHLDEPASYHQTPPPLASPARVATRRAGLEIEELSFESGYAPREGEPGRERFLGYAANRTARAHAVRRAGADGPWLICLHGYGMGAAQDVRAFEAARLRREYGLNLLMPVLPFHGPRRLGWRSGEGYVAGDFLDTVHAHAQAVWEVRRWIGWLRANGARSIGLYGLSLGGGVAALVASLEAELSGVLLGIPAVDLVRTVRRQVSPGALRAMQLADLHWGQITDVMRPVSPLALSAPPRERSFIFAGTADHVIPPDQVRDLWRHWAEPRIAWYAGSHISFFREPQARLLIDDALRTIAAD